MMEEDEERVPMLSETVLCVVYNGSSNFRILTRRDLSGNPDDSVQDELIWTPGSEIAWEYWEEFAGGRERALEILRVNAHEFALVGPGADELLTGDDEEFEEFSAPENGE